MISAIFCNLHNIMWSSFTILFTTQHNLLLLYSCSYYILYTFLIFKLILLYLATIYTCNSLYLLIVSFLLYLILSFMCLFFIICVIMKHQNLKILTNHNLNTDHNIIYNDCIIKTTLILHLIKSVILFSALKLFNSCVFWSKLI